MRLRRSLDFLLAIIALVSVAMVFLSHEAYYKAFRKGCIQTMLGVVHGKIDTRTAEALIELDKFRQYFQEPVGPRKSRWREFFNNLNETSLRELQTSTEIFRAELIFILNNTDIQKDEAFEFIKRLSASIYSLNSAMARHDEVAPLSDFLEATPLFGFLWNVFAGWDWIEGYRKEDIVKKMIDEI